MIPFVKAHACGNDFLVLEEACAKRNHAELARRLCARSTSIGADGIEFVERRQDGSLFLRLFNSDGSEAELSGNGTRCVAAWLAASEDREAMRFGTHGGERSCRVLRAESPYFEIESGMGVPRIMPRTLVLEGVGEIAGAMVNVGNPHFVLRTENDDFSAHGLAWEDLGAKISASRLFPHGTNVEFVRVLSPEAIEFRIYERGCGPTASSGTGTCASATAAMALYGTARALTATAPGGPQRVVWPSAGEPMLLTGPAEIVCTGEAYA